MMIFQNGRSFALQQEMKLLLETLVSNEMSNENYPRKYVGRHFSKYSF